VLRGIEAPKLRARCYIATTADQASSLSGMTRLPASVLLRRTVTKRLKESQSRHSSRLSSQGLIVVFAVSTAAQYGLVLRTKDFDVTFSQKASRGFVERQARQRPRTPRRRFAVSGPRLVFGF